MKWVEGTQEPQYTGTTREVTEEKKIGLSRRKIFCSQRTVLGPGESYAVGDSRKNSRHCFLRGPPQSTLVSNCGTSAEATVVPSRRWWERHSRKGVGVWTQVPEQPRGCFTFPSSQAGWKDSHGDCQQLERGLVGVPLRGRSWWSQTGLLKSEASFFLSHTGLEAHVGTLSTGKADLYTKNCSGCGQTP